MNEAAWADGLVEMSDNPVPLTPPTAIGLDPFAIGPDWLERLVDASDVWLCTGTTANRGTEYDWARFFWKMTQTAYGDIDPDQLADLYVDMCPTNWDSNETNSSANSPIERLESSAIHQGLAVHAAWTAYKHYGQDH